MKKTAIIALVGINVVLLALVIGRALPQAEAQTFRGASNYMIMTGQVENDYDAIFVLNLSKRSLKGWQLDRTTKRLTAMRGDRDLTKDFKSRGR